MNKRRIEEIRTYNSFLSAPPSIALIHNQVVCNSTGVSDESKDSESGEDLENPTSPFSQTDCRGTAFPLSTTHG